MSLPPKSRDTAVQEAAAYWDARLRNPACRDEERAAFRSWIAEDPLHGEVFEQLQRSVSALRSAAHRPELRALRDSALAPRRDVTMRTAALAAVLLLTAVTLPIGLSFLSGPQGSEPGPAELVLAEVYSTAIGQRSGITLEDGSVVTLNTDSQMQVSYSEDERLITLLKGQALFEVAHEPGRPFAVLAGGQRVVALGTTFDVHLKDTGVEVVLVEGKVEIADLPDRASRAPAKLVQLASGERLVASAAAAPVITRIDTEKATSWREGLVSFEDAPLVQAIAEMNRYSKIQILALDPELAEYRVNGVFRSGQQARFVEALEAYFPVSAQRDGDTIVMKMSQPS